MLKEKLLMAERRIQEVKELQVNVQMLINQRKLRFADIGVNEVVKTLSELMILEKITDSINMAIDVADGEIGIWGLDTLKDEVPSADEMLDYISLKYKDVLATECTTIKRFIECIEHQTITNELFKGVGGKDL